MTRAVEAKKEPAVEGHAETSASPDGVRREESKSPGDKAAALVAADLTSVQPATSGSLFFTTALALSIFLHLGVLVYLQWDNTDEIGPGGIQLEAINVDLVPVSELRLSPSKPSLGVGKDDDDQDKKDATEVARREVTETRPPEGLIKATEESSELAAAEIIKPDPLPEHREEKSDKEKLDKPVEPDAAHDDQGRAKEKQELSEQKDRGGSSATATPGQISRYALSIQQTLNANRPHHVGTRGRAVVKFALTDGGSVSSAEIQKSSGSKLIDDTVLAAIWKMRFPVPPGGMTERQRSYTAPIEFR